MLSHSLYKMNCFAASVCTCLLLCLSSSSCLGEQQPAGLRAAFTTKAFNFICHSGIKHLEKALVSQSIPDIEGKEKIKLVAGIKTEVKYKVSDIKLHNLLISTCSFTPGKDGLTLHSSSISVEIAGHVRVKHSLVKASTDIKISVSGVSFSTTVRIDRGSNGGLLISAVACSSDVGDVDVSFKGDLSWLYKLFSGTFSNLLKDGFQSTFCSSIKDEINKQGNKILHAFPLVFKLNEMFLFDYTLTEDPVYSSDYMALSLKGETKLLDAHTMADDVYSHANIFPINAESIFNPASFSAIFSDNDFKSSHNPFFPSDLPPVDIGDKMVYIWLTDYVLNSATYLLYRCGLMSSTAIGNLAFKLKTSYIAFLVPGLHNHYPDNDMKVMYNVTSPPQVSFSPEGIHLRVNGSFTLQIVLPDETLETAFELSFEAGFVVHTQVTAARVSASLSLSKLVTTLTSSSISQFDTSPLERVLDCLMSSLVLPAINYYTNRGVALPVAEGVSLVNPNLKFGETYACFSTDVSYTP